MRDVSPGDETCNAKNVCEFGTQRTCSDGLSCTDDICDESTKSCENPITGVGMDVKANVQTDNYPEENAWTINNQCGTGFTLNSPPYSFKRNLQSTEICLPSGEYYFTITDTSNDGLCCAFGQGWYEIIVDGITVHTGGPFASSETITLGVCPTTEPTTA